MFKDLKDILIQEKDFILDLEVEKIENVSDKWITNQLSKQIENDLSSIDSIDEKIEHLNNFLKLENKFKNSKLKASTRFEQIQNHLSMNKLVYNFGKFIKEEFLSSDEVLIISPFINSYSVNDLREWMIDNLNLKVKILTTTYDGTSKFLSLETLQLLAKDDNFKNRIEIKIEDSFKGNNERIHAKVYCFVRKNGFSNVYVGSNNFTKTGIYTGKEWSLKFSEFRENEIYNELILKFNEIWSDETLVNINDNVKINHLIDIQKKVNQKEKEYQKEIKKLLSNNYKEDQIELFDYQQEVISSIEQREKENKNRHLVVMATGTGKTITTAKYFSKLFNKKNKNNFNLLFVSHQKEISEQAYKTFAKIENDLKNKSIFVLDGKYKKDKLKLKQNENIFVFSTFQSIKKYINELEDINWDLVVFDEVHHIEAEKYKEIFKAVENNSKSIIGLTATPERTDGVNVDKFFGNEYAYDLSLFNSLQKQLLSPFEYYYVQDDSTDLEGFDISKEKELGKILSNPRRNKLIYDYIEKNIGRNNINVSAVLFCATIEHAEYVSEFLNSKGMKAAALTSKTEERNETINKFREKEINYLCVRDIFNEGIDVPEIDTIMLLRPTASRLIYTQQLGRGLRKIPNKKLQVFDFVNNVDLYKNKNFNPLILSEILGINKKILNDKKIETIKELIPFLPEGSNLKISDDMSSQLLQTLEQFEKQRRLKQVIKGFGDNLDYISYEKLFLQSSLVHNIKPFDLYGKESSTFFSENERFFTIFKNFSICNVRNVLEKWYEILETGKLNLNKKIDQLFMTNFLLDAWINDNNLNKKELNNLWKLTYTKDKIIKEIKFLIQLKLSNEKLQDFDIFDEENIVSYKGMNFTYFQIKVLLLGFEKYINKNGEEEFSYIKYSSPSGIHKIHKDINMNVIRTTEAEGLGEKGYINKFEEETQELIWNSPDIWDYNKPEKIQLNTNEFYVFYTSEGMDKELLGHSITFIGKVSEIIGKEPIQREEKFPNIKYKFKIK